MELFVLPLCLRHGEGCSVLAVELVEVVLRRSGGRRLEWRLHEQELLLGFSYVLSLRWLRLVVVDLPQAVGSCGAAPDFLISGVLVLLDSRC